MFAAGFGLIAAIAGICGMNLAPLPIQDTEVSIHACHFTLLPHSFTMLLATCCCLSFLKSGCVRVSCSVQQAVFVAVTAGSCTAGVLVIIGVLAWAKYRRVLGETSIPALVDHTILN